MPTPVLITGAINAAQFAVAPNAGPYLYSGKIFVFGYTAAGAAGDAISIGVWRSSDSGATWDQVGGSKSLASIVPDPGNNDLRGFSVCQGRGDGQYLYALYLAGAFATMRVSQFDCSTETWIADSDGLNYRVDDGNYAGYHLAQSTADDTIWIIANYDTDGSGHRRVQRMSIPAPFGSTWSSPTDVDGPFLGTPPNQQALACVAGYDGAVHGIFSDADGFEVRIAEISSGTPSVLAYTSAADNVQPNVTAASRVLGSDTQILFCIVDQGTTDFETSYIVGYSAAGGWASTLIVDGVSGISLKAFRDVNNDFVLYRRAGVETLQFARWTGDPGAFGADQDSGVGAGAIGGGPIPGDGIGLTYSVGSIEGDPANFDTWFTRVVPVGGADQTITGEAGIPSEEAFGRTSGVQGGGMQPCDPAGGGNPTAPACSVADPVPPPVSTYRCGYAMAI